MPPAKKLQVFVSSTYEDLRDERQAAVEAILTAGHIPAGMELFTAGDQSQMDVIRRWIDESDVFLLILGGRYGSVEPTTGKSYVHLEYEYAIERGKPLFAVVVNDAALEERVKTAGTAVIEIKNSAQLQEFRQVVLSRLVRFWSDVRDIKLAVHETMSEFGRRSDLTGWVPGDQVVSTGLLAEEIARLTKENQDLRERLKESPVLYTGLTFGKLRQLMSLETLDGQHFTRADWENLVKLATAIGDTAPNLLHFLLRYGHRSGPALDRSCTDPMYWYFERLAFYGVVSIKPTEHMDFVSVDLTKDGRMFMLRLITGS
jgi:hypothetical protein